MTPIFWAIGLAVTLLLWLGGILIARRERGIHTVVERYVSAYRAMPKEKRTNSMLQLLLDAGALDTRNNCELKEVRRRIQNQNLPDPASISEPLKRGNLHKFFRFVHQHNLRLDGAGELIAAIGRYKGVLKN
jgi:hypothetical protein